MASHDYDIGIIGGGAAGLTITAGAARLGARTLLIEKDPALGGDCLHAGCVPSKTLIRTARLHDHPRRRPHGHGDGAGEPNGRPRITIEDKNGGLSTLEAEAVLLAQGRIPNTASLGLDTIGLEHDGRGIGVDSCMHTSHRHIYAAGDVTGRYQFTHAAGYEGGIVVSNAIFHLPRKADYTWMQ